jgi:phage tail-like protein
VLAFIKKIFFYCKKLIQFIMPNYPLTTIHFRVEWGGTRIGFTEVSGLDIELEVIKYREGSSPEYQDRLMPGRIKYSNLILKRAIANGDNEFFNWMNTARLNTIERRDITISLLNEMHEPVVIWKVKNAFPVKFRSPILIANESNAAMEELELAHEGFSMEYF